MNTRAQFRRSGKTKAPVVFTPVLPGELPTLEQVNAVVGSRRGEIRHTAFASELGIHPKTVRRMWQRGGLPGAKEHGHGILVIPLHLLRLAQAWGLRQVEHMAKAGLLTTPHQHS